MDMSENEDLEEKKLLGSGGYTLAKLNRARSKNNSLER
jgi:hypothetical protein